MRKIMWAVLAAATVGLAAQTDIETNGASLVASAAEALGGKARILSLKTVAVEGYGQLAQQNGGGNITPAPDAPQKWINVNDYTRIVDLEHGRMRVQQRRFDDFVFARSPAMLAKNPRSNEGLDGDIAFNVAPDGQAKRGSNAVARARRMEMLADPIAIVRAALNPTTKLGRVRALGGPKGEVPTVDLTIGKDTLTLGIDKTTHLPAWVSWVGPDINLGDVTYKTAFTGYQRWGGMLLPTGLNTTIDFRNVVQSKLYIDQTRVDAPIGDLAAPQAARSAPPASPPTPKPRVTPIAQGVWFIDGAGANSALFEFADHLTLFEAQTSEAWSKAVIDTARAVVPRKPLTEVIVSHHHFDHTGGLRTAIAEGLTVVTHRGNVDFFKEMAARPAKLFPDALSRNPKPLKIRAVDDHIELKDGSMAIDIYAVVANNHMANAVMIYVPRDRTLIQADLFSNEWDLMWWGESYTENIKYRKLQVDRDVPMHGKIQTEAEVLKQIDQQVANARDLCKTAATAGFGLQGCPPKF